MACYTLCNNMHNNDSRFIFHAVDGSTKREKSAPKSLRPSSYEGCCTSTISPAFEAEV